MNEATENAQIPQKGVLGWYPPYVFGQDEAMCWQGDTRDGALGLRDCREAITEHVARTVGAEAPIESVDQIVGELLGNVCRHAPGKFCVEVHPGDCGLDISVHDSGGCFDPSGVPPAEDIAWKDERGRGLAIVAALGGTIETQRERQGGCRVSVAIPLGENLSKSVVPSHCPHDHPATRKQHCPRVAESIPTRGKSDHRSLQG